MPKCQNCDSQVSFSYAKVLGNNNDEVHSCQSCENKITPKHI